MKNRCTKNTYSIIQIEHWVDENRKRHREEQEAKKAMATLTLI
jgi:hypothetical protein